MSYISLQCGISFGWFLNYVWQSLSYLLSQMELGAFHSVLGSWLFLALCFSIEDSGWPLLGESHALQVERIILMYFEDDPISLASHCS